MSTRTQLPLRALSSQYDAVVVGARAAGAATAMLLARRGLRVLAVDRTAEGSDTLSTHALMRGAVTRLERWGVLDQIWAGGTPVIDAVEFRYGDALVRVDVAPSDTVPGLAAPRRTLLDPVLVAAAREAGAAVIHRTRVLSLEQDTDGRVTGVLLADEDGATRRVGAGIVIGADGLQSSVARQVGAPVTRMGTHAAAVIMRHVVGADLPRDAYTWLYRPDLGGGIIPTSGDAWCVFVSLPQATFRRSARLEPAACLLHALSTLDPATGAAVAAATPAGPVRTWPGLPGRFRRPYGPGWALVGDAGYFKDPAAAHGITDAFRDAELLCEAIVDDDLPRYERVRDELSAPLFDVLEHVAGFQWDLTSLPNLHRQLSNAMRDEELALTSRRDEELALTSRRDEELALTSPREPVGVAA